MYIPLRVSTAYSIGHGSIRHDELAEFCLAAGIPAAGIADRASLGGALVASKTLKAKGVQPLIGGVYPVSVEGTSGEVVLFATGLAGWKALLAISNAWTLQEEKTRVAPTLAELAALGGTGLNEILLLTGGPEGPVDRAAAGKGGRAAAAAALDAIAAAFPGRTYLEIQRGHAAAGDQEALLVGLAAAAGVPLVGTCPATHAGPEMQEAHDAYLCITGKTYLLQDDRARAIEGQHLRTQDEMAALFADLPEALENSVEIARRAAFVLEGAAPRTPSFPVAAGETEESLLRRLAGEGLDRRLASRLVHGRPADAAAYGARLAYELDVIVRMGFSGYFLIVADFIGWARGQDIPVGPGRGSGAGSLVAYALGITDIDPLDYGLLFERFLNPDRVSMPDFDIDFAQERREEVIEYVRAKYGDAHVAHIATTGTLQARAVVRDVGRVMQVPFPVVDRLAKLIPQNPANPVSLAEAMELEELREALAAADGTIQAMFRTALKLEGLYRHVSTHAAGVIISDQPIADLVPVHRDANGKVATAYDMKAVEAAGLIKFDFLGLKNLDIVKGTIDFVRATKSEEIDFEAIGVDDRQTYGHLADGDGFCVFQVESSGMRQAMREVRIGSIEELIALISLYRPGPMDQIETYARVKRGEEKVRFAHPEMAEVLTPTNGVMIYQEQVMEIARRLAGYSLGEADLLRRAMGKKIKAEMDAQRARFQDGAAAGWVEVTTATGETKRLHALTRVPVLDGSGRRVTLAEALEQGLDVAL